MQARAAKSVTALIGAGGGGGFGACACAAVRPGRCAFPVCATGDSRRILCDGSASGSRSFICGGGPPSRRERVDRVGRSVGRSRGGGARERERYEGGEKKKNRK